MIRLSRREREVAELVADGLTNREIAERLFISERTAEGHIQQIRNKLGFNSRTQIAAWAVERRLEGFRPEAAVRSSSAVPAVALAEATQPMPLPVSLSTFIGRRRELDDLKSALAATRLLTLTGPAGCGKTRLAVQLAWQCLGGYPDGVSFVDLAPLSDPQLVPRAALLALGLKEQPGQLPTEALIAHMHHRRSLLLLDNCEHLVGACASFAEQLMWACPRLSLVATSRERLRVPGEASWPVGPLPVPPANGSERPETVGEYDAVRLFTNRAALNLPSFAESAENIEISADICRRLDGIPLAIELAAAHVAYMPLAQILQRLESRFELLTTGSRTGAARQQTLEAAVHWSYELLNEGERLLFRRLSIFAGGFRLESAEAVCAGEGLQSQKIAGMLSQLAEGSLVVFEPRPDGTGRYRLLETLRQYGRDRLLEKGEAEALRSRHFEHFLSIARSTEPVQDIGFRERLLVLDQELDNLRMALDWSRTLEGDAELQLVVPFGAFCYAHGHLSEGRERIEPAIDRARDETEARTEAHFQAGRIAQKQGDHLAELRHFEEAMRGRTKEATVAGRLHEGLGTALMLQGRLTEARQHYQQALKIASGLGTEGPQAAILNSLANLAYETGDLADARAAATTSLSVTKRLDIPGVTAFNLKLLGEICLREGNGTDARIYFSDALRIFRLRTMGDHFMAASMLDDFAWLAAAQSRPDRALRLAGAASGLRLKLGAAARPDFERRVSGAIERARQELAPAARVTVWEDGRSMSSDEAIAYALGEES